MTLFDTQHGLTHWLITDHMTLFDTHLRLTRLLIIGHMTLLDTQHRLTHSLITDQMTGVVLRRNTNECLVRADWMIWLCIQSVCCYLNSWCKWLVVLYYNSCSSQITQQHVVITDLSTFHNNNLYNFKSWYSNCIPQVTNVKITNYHIHHDIP